MYTNCWIRPTQHRSITGELGFGVFCRVGLLAGLALKRGNRKSVTERRRTERGAGQVQKCNRTDTRQEGRSKRLERSEVNCAGVHSWPFQQREINYVGVRSCFRLPEASCQGVDT
jgi:hypothetical protein